jgi:hypothetical protein
MKTFNLLLIMCTAVSVAVTCAPESKNKNTPPEWPKYSLVVTGYTPDSVIQEQGKFISETCKAATFNLKTSDYEDVDDLVEEATYSANQIYRRDVRALRIETRDGASQTILPHLMTKQERTVYDSLMNK